MAEHHASASSAAPTPAAAPAGRYPYHGLPFVQWDRDTNRMHFWRLTEVPGTPYARTALGLEYGRALVLYLARERSDAARAGELLARVLADAAGAAGGRGEVFRGFLAHIEATLLAGSALMGLGAEVCDGH
jgi:hypothetical protein